MNVVTANELVTTPTNDSDHWIRLPGLFRKWEFEQVVDVGHAYKFEPAGATDDGTPLVAVYVRDEKEGA